MATEKDQINVVVNDQISPAALSNRVHPNFIAMPPDEKHFSHATTSPVLNSPTRVSSPPLYGDRFDRAYNPLVRGTSFKRRTTQTFGELEKSQSPTAQTPDGLKYSYIDDERPVEPRELEALPKNIWSGLFDAVYFILPLIFVLYGILAAILHNKPTTANILDPDGNGPLSRSQWGQRMLQIQNFIPTLFPMAFGVTLGYLIKVFALWRAQHGTRLGFLEQLMGSLSLGGSLTTLVGLQIFNVVGVILVMLWALAPIGSQVGLRMIDNNGTLTNVSDVYFMNTDGIPNGLAADDDQYQYYTYAVNSVYSTSIITPNAQLAPQDPWANVKLPSLEWLQRQNGCGADGWCSFDIAKDYALANNNTNFKVTAGTYAGLTGVPVVGGNFGMGYQEFVMDVNYYVINCSEVEKVSPSMVLNSSLPLRNATYNTQPNSPIWHSSTSTNPNTFFVDTNTPVAGLGDPAGNARSSSTNMAPRDLVFGSRMYNMTTLAKMTIWTSNIQAQVQCNFTSSMWNLDHTSSQKTADGACYVSQVRRAPGYTGLSPYTQLDIDWHIPQRLFDNWPDATGPVPLNSSSATEKFIDNTVTNGTSPVLVATTFLGYQSAATAPDGSSYVDLSTLDPLTFSERFGLLFNTYWHSYCNIQALTQTEVGLGFGDIMPANAMFENTPATMQLAGQFYQVHFVYWGLYMVAALISLAAGILSLFLKYKTIAPDVFGSVSMYVKENPYTPTPAGGTALDGHAYSQRVMNMPVRFMDVKPNEPTGHIVLTSMETSYFEDDATRLRKDRPYR